MGIAEGLVRCVYQTVFGISIEPQIRRLTWREAMDHFGSYKPDLRFGMELQDLSGILSGTGFRVFKVRCKEAAPVAGSTPRVFTKTLLRKIDKAHRMGKAYGAKDRLDAPRAARVKALSFKNSFRRTGRRGPTAWARSERGPAASSGRQARRPVIRLLGALVRARRALT